MSTIACDRLPKTIYLLPHSSPHLNVLVAHVIDGLIRSSSCKCDQVD